MMDSGNSGSLQSSSGGDDDYDDPRAESISAFLSPTGHVGPMSNPQEQPQPQPQPPPHHHTHSSLFDSLSNYFDPVSRSPPIPNPSSLLNLDPVWPKTLRSDPNCTEIGGLMVPPSSAAQSFLTSTPSMSYPPAPENAARGSGPASASTDQTNVVRNPKKRSRASRRAPTTVLTTDTTNFRAMVQEFTGIPAPPFTSSGFPRSRLDLFGTASTVRSGSLDGATTPYLLRPFAQKVQPPPFVVSSSSSMVDSIASTTNNNSNTAQLNYQPQNLLNMQNPIFTFQSLLQNPSKYPLANTPNNFLGSKSQGSLEIPLNDSHLKMGGLEDFGLSGHGHGHGHVSAQQLIGFPNMLSTDGVASTSRADNNNPPSWSAGVGSNGAGDQAQLRPPPVNGSYGNSQRVSNGKMNYSASSSDFRGDKPPESVSARSEGMVESWICSSD